MPKNEFLKPLPSGPFARWRSRNRARFGVLLGGILALLWIAESLAAATLHVFAAASLNDCLQEIGAAYQAESGNKVFFNFGASSFLARQIEAGAPADLFFSADEAKMDGLEKLDLIVKETRRTRLSNALVIVVAADSSLRLESAQDLAGTKIRRLALADPRTVPAGMYAKQYLVESKLWTALESKVIPTDNVRAALAAVESGNLEAGLVYKTDAAISRRVRIAYEIPAQDQPDIRYSVAVLKEAKSRQAAQEFWTCLQSEEAGRIFAKHGFIVLENHGQ